MWPTRRDCQVFQQRSPLVQLLEDVFSCTHVPTTTRSGFPNHPYSNPRATASPHTRPKANSNTPLSAKIFQATSQAFQTRNVYILLTALSSPLHLSLCRDKFTYEMFLRSKQVQLKKTNGKGGRKVILSSLTLWFRNQVHIDSLGQHLHINRTPIPEILLLGTDKRIIQPLPFMRTYLNNQGIQLDVMDTASPM